MMKPGIKLGINQHNPHPDSLAVLKEIGFRYVRWDFSWDILEPERGSRNYEQMDYAVNWAQENNVDVLGVLAYTPGWANGGNGRNYPPLDEEITYWQRFVGLTIQRYRWVKHWEIWNEPNLSEFFHGNAAEYMSKVFVPAKDVIRDYASRHITMDYNGPYVCGPALAHLKGANWSRWMRDILGAHLYTDAIAVITHHNYPRDAKELWKRMGKVKEIQSREGHGCKPLWLTEVGRKVGRDITEADQAEWYRTLLPTFDSNKIDRAYIYVLYDDGNPEFAGFGLTGPPPEFRMKPAGEVVKEYLKKQGEENE